MGSYLGNFKSLHESRRTPSSCAESRSATTMYSFKRARTRARSDASIGVDPPCFPIEGVSHVSHVSDLPPAATAAALSRMRISMPMRCKSKLIMELVAAGGISLTILT